MNQAIEELVHPFSFSFILAKNVWDFVHDLFIEGGE